MSGRQTEPRRTGTPVATRTITDHAGSKTRWAPVFLSLPDDRTVLD